MSRANPTLVGSFVVGGIALGIAAAIALGAQGASGHVKKFVVQLTGTVNGLRRGAPVKYKGVQIGEVDDIKIRVVEKIMADEATRDLPIAVFCSIDEKRLLSSTIGTPDRRASVPELVEYGLRAQLASESMVTGILYISLTFTPEEVGTRHGEVDGLPEVPALQSSSERMESGVEIVLDKLSGLDLAGLVEELKRAVKSIGDLAEKTDSLAVELASGVADARAALASAQQLIEHADRAIDPFSTSLTAAAGDVGGAARRLTGTLDSFDSTANPDAPLVVELRASLAELASAARAARSLLEQIDRDPSQLLRGRSVGSGDSR